MEKSREILNIYCINLDQRPDRWHRMEHQRLPKLLLPSSETLPNIHRCSAITPEHSRVDMVYESAKTRNASITKKMTACLLSHHHIWELCASSAKDESTSHHRVLILEDDVFFAKDCWCNLHKSMQQLDSQYGPDGWDIFYLNSSSPHNPTTEEGVCPAKAPIWLAGAYVLNGARVAQLLIEECWRNPNTSDDVMLRVSAKRKKSHTIVPNLAVQDNCDSDIQQCIAHFNRQQHETRNHIIKWKDWYFPEDVEYVLNSHNR